mmetsp:Transcript_21654/g.38444  ORF Transcript_21654/g.38444 Transcript_21654/m.38444 type:complete len:409 (+) Transcript_21654:56-1282(+)
MGRKRIPWTPEEEDALVKGVQRYGVGKWADIKADWPNIFNPLRTSVHLKDKWRNLSKKQLLNNQAVFQRPMVVEHRQQNLYEVLGVQPGASQTDIKKAYHTAALKYHPDKNGSQESSQKYVEISEAYTKLKDPEVRKEYDRRYSSSFKSQKKRKVQETESGSREPVSKRRHSPSSTPTTSSLTSETPPKKLSQEERQTIQEVKLSSQKAVRGSQPGKKVLDLTKQSEIEDKQKSKQGHSEDFAGSPEEWRNRKIKEFLIEEGVPDTNIPQERCALVEKARFALVKKAERLMSVQKSSSSKSESSEKTSSSVLKKEDNEQGWLFRKINKTATSSAPSKEQLSQDSEARTAEHEIELSQSTQEADMFSRVWDAFLEKFQDRLFKDRHRNLCKTFFDHLIEEQLISEYADE